MESNTSGTPFRIGARFRTTTGELVEIKAHSNVSLRGVSGNFIRGVAAGEDCDWNAATGKLWNGPCLAGNLLAEELHGAAALMQWLGEHMPQVQRIARATTSLTFFYAYMGELSGARFSHSPNSHDEYCEVYLAAFKAKHAKAPEPTLTTPTSIPFERPRTQREAEWMLRQAMAKDVAEAAAREAEARRCAPLPACDGLTRLAPLGR